MAEVIIMVVCSMLWSNACGMGFLNKQAPFSYLRFNIKKAWNIGWQTEVWIMFYVFRCLHSLTDKPTDVWAKCLWKILIITMSRIYTAAHMHCSLPSGLFRILRLWTSCWYVSTGWHVLYKSYLLFTGLSAACSGLFYWHATSVYTWSFAD